MLSQEPRKIMAFRGLHQGRSHQAHPGQCLRVMVFLRRAMMVRKAYFIAHIPEKRPQVQILTADGSGLDSSKANVQIEKWNAEEKEREVTSKQPVWVGLRLLNYPAWRVEVNGKLAKTKLSNPMNQIILPVPEGRSEIRVRFTRTADRI